MRNLLSVKLATLGLLLLNVFSLSAQKFKIEDVVKWTEKHNIPANAKVGDIVNLQFSVTLKDGYHIYASQPPVPGKGPKPTEFFLDKESRGVEAVGKMEDGKGKKVEMDEIFEVEVAYYEKTATFTQKVKITEENPNVVGHLAYQVCDDGMCIPANLPFKLAIKTLAGTKVTDPSMAGNTKLTPEQIKANEKRKADSIAEAAKKATDAAIQNQDNQSSSILSGIHWSVSAQPDGSQQVKTGDIITLTYKALIDPSIRCFSVLPQKGGTILMPSFDLDMAVSKNLEEVGDITITGTKKTAKDAANANSEMVYYEDSVKFVQQLRVTGDNPVLKGILTFHGGDGKTTAVGKQDMSAFTWKQATLTQTPANKHVGEGCDLWALIIAGILAGLAAFTTPCFYPMVPLTVSYFTKQSGSRWKGILNAFVYGTSIVVMFTGVVLLIAVIFGPAVLNKIATNPWVNIGLFLLIFAFGLSFLGLFDITLPSGFVNAVSRRGNASSISGIFFMAATLVLVSFSCTGAFVAPLVGEAAKGSSWICIIVPMLAFSSALALPFMILALFPSLLQSMPRSGNWLGTFKVTLGFLEIALAFTYLTNPDQQWDLNILSRPVFIAIWMGLFGTLAYYLFGRLHIKGNDVPTEGVTVPRLLVGILFLALTVFMIPGMFDRRLPILESTGILPPVEKMEEGNAQHTASASNDICNYPNKKHTHLNKRTPEGLCAFYDLDQGLEYAKKVNKPVLLDFTGHSCKNCRKIEQNVWVDGEVKKMLSEDYVLVSLFTDDEVTIDPVEVTPEGEKLYTLGDKCRDYENRTYGFIAQPYYVLLDHDNTKLIEPWDYQAAPDVASYKAKLQAGLDEFKKRHP